MTFICTDLRDHDELRTEADKAEQEEQEFPAAGLAEHFGEQIYDRCHHHLQCNKLQGKIRAGTEDGSRVCYEYGEDYYICICIVVVVFVLLFSILT